MLSITTEKRKRFCTHAKTDKNVYCVFSPLSDFEWQVRDCKQLLIGSAYNLTIVLCCYALNY